MCGSVFGIRIRIHKADEYGSNTDPDPKHWFDLFCLLRFAQSHNLVCLRDFSLSFIYNNFYAVSGEEEFLDTNKEHGT